jgi:hypothetical protein
MDKVLTRKLFRQKYFQSHLPVKKYQEGGIASLTPREKAIYAATFAAPLLQARQAKGQTRLSSLLEAFGKGVEQLPATIMAIEKSKPSQAMRLLTPAEVKAAGLTEGTVAQVGPEGIKVVQAPSAEEVKQTQAARRVQSIIGNIEKGYYTLGKPVGPLGLDVNRIRAVLGRAGTSEYSKQYGKLKASIQQATSFISQAISGAAVSEQEAKRIQKMIPQLGDTEVTFEAKLETLGNYFKAAEQIAQGNNITLDQAMNSMEQTGASDQFLDVDLSKVVTLKKEGDVIDVTGN